MSTGGLNAKARANESNCFSPTEKPAPRSRTSASYVSGRRSMNRLACTRRAASRTVSGAMRGSASEMF